MKPQKSSTGNIVPEPVAAAIKAVEERVKTYENMKHKRWRRKTINRIFEVATLLATFVTFWYVYMMWRNHIHGEMEKEKLRQDAELSRQIELDKLRSEERERLRKEAETERERVRAERLREENERKAKKAAKEEATELYSLMTLALRENDFDIFGKNVTNALEGTGAALCYLFPCDSKNLPFYCVDYPTNSSARAIYRLTHDGEKTRIEESAFNALLLNRDYLVAKNGSVYFKSRRKNPKTGVLSKVKDGDPSEVFFGSLASTLQVLKPTYNELTYDIIFIPKNKDRKIVVENLEFGCAYHIGKVKDAIAEEYAKKAISSGTLKLTKYKRTVKLYSGSMIKRGVDGITYVPRSQPARNLYGTSSCSRWLSGYRTIYRTRTRNVDEQSNWASLYAQAQREDEEEKDFYEKQKKDFLENKQRKQTKAEQEWARKLDSIFEEGSLIYSIRKMVHPEL